MTRFQLDDSTLVSIINGSSIGMLLVQEDGTIVFANYKAEHIFGVTSGTLTGSSIATLLPERLRADHTGNMARFFASPESRPMGVGRKLVGLHSKGMEIPLEIGLSPITIQERLYVLASVVDISDRERAEILEESNKALQYDATRDPLTNLPNRRLLVEFIENARNLAVRNKGRMAFLFIDLDGFKQINDQYGHSEGDHVLREVAAAIREQVRKSDIVGRLGGDEFLMCLTEVSDSAHVNSIANKLVKAISTIEHVDGTTIPIGASIGVVITGMTHDVVIDDVIKAADQLMYQAKQSGKGRVVMAEYGLFPHS